MQRFAFYFAAFCVFSSTKSATPTDNVLKYEAPDDCQWWIKDQSTGNEDVALTCNLRTINSEFDNTNFSVIPSEHTTSLRIVCNPKIMSKSSLEDGSFSHLIKLRELELENCKLGKWSEEILGGLRDLRNLSVRTYNTEWPAMNLEFSKNSFSHVRQLEKLDLSCNNIWSFPEHLFCPLINLVHLNISENRLQDISDLGFREKHTSAQPLISDEYQTETTQIYSGPCNLAIQILDVSYNHFVLLPANSFSVLKNLKELYLHNNEISMVADKSLSGLRSLQIFDLSNNKIVALPSELFKDCSASIKEINLQNNSLSVLAPGLFSNLEQLLALHLSRNLLSSSWINANTFSGLIRLVLLNLSYNRITKLEPAFFKDLYTLQILNLEHNLLEIIPADTFAPMNNLHTLIISFNKITYLDAYSLNGLYVLSLLALDNNLLEGVHPEAFRNCSSLQDLNLNGNKLNMVPLALKDMRLLRTVDLGENSITSIDEPGFKGMSNLYGLRLIGNSLQNVSKKAFADLPALQILNLARNRIEKIEQGTFDSNSNLQAIRIDANQVSDISGLFTRLQTLLWLNVSDNQIEWFDYAMIPKGLQWLDIHKNNIRELGNHYGLDLELKLQRLDGSFNKLTKISPANIPSSLEYVYLNDNLISTVEPHAFLKTRNLTRVDLYANQITSMDLNALRLTIVDNKKPLPEFYIGGNPFQCDCTMEWLQRINKLDHLRQHPRVMDLESIYCRLLYSRDNNYLPLIEVESSQFLCPYKTHCFALCHCCDFDACDCEMTCPTNCTCYHDQSWSANVVECSSVGYTEMPSSIPMDATEVYLDGNNFGELSSHSFIGRKNLKVLYVNGSSIAAVYNHTFSGLRRLNILHLEYNRIKQLLGFEFITLENLKELYLQNNMIHFIDNRTFAPLKHLEILRLEGNRLKLFEVWQLSLNPYLVEIGLSENPWSCDCVYVQDYQNYLNLHQGKIVDVDKILCIFNNHSKDITGYHMSDYNATMCEAYAGRSRAIVGTQVMNHYLPLLLGTMCVFLVSAVLVCIIFYYRQELRVWIYSRCGLRMCYKTTVFEGHQDKDRLFDAYVSYSVKDEAFVNNVLAPGLESGDPSYRLCLHYRDFNVSAYIADTIIEAVECSRRTIIILSKNFLMNEWCRFEFKSALFEVLKERRHKLIFILIDDHPQTDFDPDLRLYLKTNTVIQWGDRQFWQKLQFAMPDARRSCGHQRSALNIYAAPTPSYLDRDGSPNLPPPPPPNGKFASLLHHHPSIRTGSLSRDTRTLPHTLWA